MSDNATSNVFAASFMQEPGKWNDILRHVASTSQKLLTDFTARNSPELLANMTRSFEDPAHYKEAFSVLLDRILKSPESVMDDQIAFWKNYLKLCKAALAQFSGEAVPMPPVIEPNAHDKRFKDPAWSQVWLFDFVKQSYLLMARFTQSVLEKKYDIDPKLRKKIDFATNQTVDALAPDHFWMTNPEVLRETYDTNGENLIRGFQNLLQDLERGHGELAITMSKNSVFKFGENIATSKGKVVYQNNIMQLLFYAPTTENVFKTPMLIVPPWINKFYILDLKEKNSFIRHLVAEGHSVFCISWVNPDARHANLTFDDYMQSGILEAMGQIKKITKSDDINALGYCIGGTLLASTLGFLQALGDNCPEEMPQVKSATYLVSLVDFSEPGELGVFIDEEQVTALEKRMKPDGYLRASTLNLTFNMLRSNDLVWSFVVNNYLLGRDPLPFDLLTWNSDSTNLPAKMQSFYLRNMYMQNNLVKPNAMKMKGLPIDLSKVRVPNFIIGTKEDHITPWCGVYAGTQVYGSTATFVLGKSGHIAGVVNPPAAHKYGYWTNSITPRDPEAWLATATEHEGSWWPCWYQWLSAYGGEKVPATDRQPFGIQDAPGDYVKVRAL